jgi:hypothetical protein
VGEKLPVSIMITVYKSEKKKRLEKRPKKKDQKNKK